MAITQSEFNALSVGSQVIIGRKYPSLIVRRGIVDRITKTMKVVRCNGVDYGFTSPTRQRGERLSGFSIINQTEEKELLERIAALNNEARLNAALRTIGNMSTRLHSGDEILMALADATAKAENFFRSR